MNYLEVNNIGGSLSSTVSQINNSRYHSVLTISKNPPVERRILVSRLSEKIFTNNKVNYISSYKTVNEEKEIGYKNIIDFNNKYFPEWIYKIDNIIIKKTLFMIKDENISIVIYKNISKSNSKIEIIPYLNDRDIHSNNYGYNLFFEVINTTNNMLEIKTNKNNNIFVKTNGTIKEIKNEINNIYYEEENERGLFSYENLLSIFNISKELKENKELYIIFGNSEKINNIDYQEEYINRIKYVKNITKNEKNETLKKLSISCDKFICSRKSTNKKTILAGYPWFTDWGRDTMISIDGLLIERGYYQTTKEVISNFLNNLYKGIIPNVFDDYNGNSKYYNNADATLWMFISLYNYYQKTLDLDFIQQTCNYLDDIIKKHIEGTINNIYIDSDGLISIGNESTQLTWMDVKVENWIVTPRYGKCVEINLLWYNALKIYEYFCLLLKKDFKYSNYIINFESNFINKFWNDKNNCLYDIIINDMKDDSIRPNQIIGISLPYNLLSVNKIENIINITFEHLYTPYGLRTLSIKNKKYIGIYKGNNWSRDGSYHQGNAWPWLLGPLFKIVLKYEYFGNDTKLIVKSLLNPIVNKINYEWNGTIPEIVEGNFPYNYKGCFSQAWSVSEIYKLLNILN